MNVWNLTAKLDWSRRVAKRRRLSILLKFSIVFACILSIILISQTTCHALPPCRVIDLGPTGGGRVTAINEAAQVVGNNLNGPFLWENGVFTSLPALGDSSSAFFSGVASDINNHGQIVGWSMIDEATDERHACLWENGSVVDIVVMDGFHTSSAFAINDGGQVVGSASNGHAFLWQDGEARDIHPVGLAGATNAYDINEASQIVGSISSANGGAAIWEESIFNYLDTTYLTYAKSINNTGMIVGGWNCGGDPCPRSWYWDALALPPQWVTVPMSPSPSSAIAVNDHGIIVGRSGINSGVYWEDGAYYSLESLIPDDSGWWIGIPSDINNRNQVVGVGVYKGAQRFYLLTPVTICLANFDNDQDVDADDLFLFASLYGEAGDTTGNLGDFDYDGDVDGSDVAAVLTIEMGCNDCP